MDPAGVDRGHVLTLGRVAYERAWADGQRTVAEGFAHLFGEGECGGCQTVFPVAAQVTGPLLPTPR